jgi:23S rRNA (adenine2503-C2)-methyltransferase
MNTTGTVSPAKHELKGMYLAELKQFAKDLGEPDFRGAQLASWMYEKGVSKFSEMTNLSKKNREKLEEIAQVTSLQIAKQARSHRSPTTKYLFALPDGQTIESVLIGGTQRNTLCISSQVGCALGCRFCASGLAGLSRNMTAGEIVDQVLRVRETAGANRDINNLVLMGMGEPLANYDNVMRAVRIINAPWGLGIGARRITISTSGLTPRIYRLAEEGIQFELSVSLHAADNSTRTSIMPINKRYPIEGLIEACRHYIAVTNRIITFEYILLDGINDRFDDARNLISLLRNLKCKVNLIPYNPVEGLPYETPAQGRQQAFYESVVAGGLTTTIRRERGRDIDAACGQLRLKELTGEPLA